MNDKTEGGKMLFIIITREQGDHKRPDLPRAYCIPDVLKKKKKENFT